MYNLDAFDVSKFFTTPFLSHNTHPYTGLFLPPSSSYTPSLILKCDFAKHRCGSHHLEIPAIFVLVFILNSPVLTSSIRFFTNALSSKVSYNPFPK